MAPKKKGKGKKKGQRKKTVPSGPDPAATPEPAERGQLAGLRSRPDLNGRRVEVKGEDAGKDGAPRFAVRLLFGVGAGTVLKVKAANLDLDRDRVLDPAMATLVAEMQALAPGAPPPEERRGWAGGRRGRDRRPRRRRGGPPAPGRARTGPGCRRSCW